MPDVHTLPGAKLPEEPSPTLLFHKWHRYDRFTEESEKKQAFSREGAALSYLTEVSRQVQRTGVEHYDRWRQRRVDAWSKLDAEPAIQMVTLWRMVVGWGTNPAWETGLVLDHLHGFPYVPGSAVKGLLHRVAELELGEMVPSPPSSPTDVEATPPTTLVEAVDQALLLRTLFGSLHLCSDEGQPGSALEALETWQKLAHHHADGREGKYDWKPVAEKLDLACAAAGTGGMVTCFDAVLAAGSFAEDRSVLKVDVLTPHTDNKPNPILFLTVRDDIKLEIRYRLASWPPGKPRDSAEEERILGLGSHTREQILARLKDWLIRGATEQGLGGKTSAGYGYLEERGAGPSKVMMYPEPPLPEKANDEPDEEASEEEPESLTEEEAESPAEREARKMLTSDMEFGHAVTLLDKALADSPSPGRTALVQRFLELHPEQLEEWKGSPAPKNVKRIRGITEILEGLEEDRESDDS